MCHDSAMGVYKNTRLIIPIHKRIQLVQFSTVLQQSGEFLGVFHCINPRETSNPRVSDVTNPLPTSYKYMKIVASWFLKVQLILFHCQFFTYPWMIAVGVANEINPRQLSCGKRETTNSSKTHTYTPRIRSQNTLSAHLASSFLFQSSQLVF